MELDILRKKIIESFQRESDRDWQLNERRNWVGPKDGKTSNFPKKTIKKIPGEVIEIINRKYLGEEEFDFKTMCFSHQVEAIKKIFEGNNVVITTPAASGKSLCYQVPILTELAKNDDSTMLLMFPTKALGRDQLDSIVGFAEDVFLVDSEYAKGRRFLMSHLCGKEVYIGDYTGGTERYERFMIRKKARVIFTNPDELHVGILPWVNCPRYAKKWLDNGESSSVGSFRRFFSNLKYVVVDEVHSYRGVFGANVAHVMRRLRLLCQKLGNEDLIFICCSATIGNPLSHAERLIGLPFKEISNDGSPKYRKDFFLWNPPFREDDVSGERRYAFTDALNITERVLVNIKKTPKTIYFLPTVPQTNHFARNLQNILKRVESKLSDTVAPFTGPMTEEEKTVLQEKIRSGKVHLIASTSALELGIDIGDLSLCILIGFPGNMVSVIQRAGRVGRKGESLVILILRDSLLEQFFSENHDVFFGLLEKPANVQIPMENYEILKWQIQCVIEEGRRGNLYKYLDSDIKNIWGEDIKVNIIRAFLELEDDGKIEIDNRSLREGGKVYWRLKRGEGDDLYSKSIRIPISHKLFNVKTLGGKEIAKFDLWRAGLYLHEGAIWLQSGNYYRVTKYDEDIGEIVVEELDNDPDYETRPHVKYWIEIDKVGESKNVGMFSIFKGTIKVSRSINGFFRIKEDKIEERHSLYNIKDIVFETSSIWLKLEKEKLHNRMRTTDPEKIEEGLEGLGMVLTTSAPLQIECEKHDLQYKVESSLISNSNSYYLFIFDSYSGGLGLSYEIYNSIKSFIKYSERLVDLPAKLRIYYRSKDLENGNDKKGVVLKDIEPIVVDKESVQKLLSLLRK